MTEDGILESFQNIFSITLIFLTLFCQDHLALNLHLATRVTSLAYSNPTYLPSQELTVLFFKLVNKCKIFVYLFLFYVKWRWEGMKDEN